MPSMVIDVHTHVFPAGSTEKIFSTLKERAHISHYSDGTVGGLQDSMERAGIDISIISRITTKPQQVDSVNRWLLEHCESNIFALATIHPHMEMPQDFIKKLRQKGFKGIKVHPDYQGFYVDDKQMYPYYEAAQTEKMPILFHTGRDRGLPPPVRALPERIAKLLEDFPRLTIIAAHMGGEGNYDDTETFLLGSDIFLDTSFVLRFMPKTVLKRFIMKHSMERLLFGSDSPWTEQQAELEYLYSLPFISKDAKEKIAGINAARLFGL